MSGFWRRLSSGLSRTASKLGEGINNLSKQKLDADTLESLEDLMIEADLGIETASEIIETFSRIRHNAEVSGDEIKAMLAAEIEKRLAPVAKPLEIDSSKQPFVLLVAGVNGSGKTTTIGKLTARYMAEGKTVMLAAADTFRAAAIEQLGKWAERTGAAIIAREQGSDPAGVVFEALKKARTEKADLLIVDTAGRLQNRAELMAELEKMVRAIRKLDATAPHAVLLVLDATVGQNAISQVEAFAKTAGLTGLVMTKLDGTARGGILVAVAAKFGLPVHFVGVGESVEDLAPFDAGEFARALVGLSTRLD